MPNRTCPECNVELAVGQLACLCGWTDKAVALTNANYTVRQCQGCHRAMIRERTGTMGHPFCKWCQNRGTVEFRYPEPPSEPGPYLTKEEFGVNLFECIRAFAARDQVRICQLKIVNDRALTDGKRRRALDDLARADSQLSHAIVDLLPTLDAGDVRRLLTRYEQ